MWIFWLGFGGFFMKRFFIIFCTKSSLTNRNQSYFKRKIPENTFFTLCISFVLLFFILSVSFFFSLHFQLPYIKCIQKKKIQIAVFFNIAFEILRAENKCYVVVWKTYHFFFIPTKKNHDFCSGIFFFSRTNMFLVHAIWIVNPSIQFRIYQKEFQLLISIGKKATNVSIWITFKCTVKMIETDTLQFVSLIIVGFECWNSSESVKASVYLSDIDAIRFINVALYQYQVHHSHQSYVLGRCYVEIDMI